MIEAGSSGPLTRRRLPIAATLAALIALAAVGWSIAAASAHLSKKPPTSSSPSDLGLPGSWSLVFEDQFDGSSLDPAKWTPNWLGPTRGAVTDPVSTQEIACYSPSRARVTGGSLHLVAVARPCTSVSGKHYAYSSGIVQSHDQFQFTYGLMEARIWLPPNGGQVQNWPAFWADGTGAWPSTGEIDVMEGLESQLCWHFHYTGGAAGSCFAPSASGWHVYAADWEPGGITFYFDGKLVGSTTEGITSSPMYLVVDLGLSSTASPPVVAPSRLKVDYVHVWQHA